MTPSPVSAPRPGLLLAGLLLGLLTALPAPAAEVVGRVISRVGEVAAVGPDGERRPLERRSPVREGETLVTGEAGRAQVRFKDRGLVDLKPASRFTIKRYRAKADGDDADSAVMELIKGGMRTITGAVGGGDGQEYEVETPVASIGIRGTQYVLRLCRGDCGGDVADGLYGGVSQGRIGVTNAAGSAAFGGDRYFHVASPDSRPEGLLTPPGDLLAGRVPARDGGGEDDGLAGGAPAMGSYLNAAARPAPSTRAFSVEAGYERGEHVNDDGQPEGTTITDPATGEVVLDPEAYLASGSSGGDSSGSGTTPLVTQPGAGFALYDGQNPAPTVSGFASVPGGDSVTLDSNGNVTALSGTGQVADETAPTQTYAYDFSANTGATPVETGDDSTLDIHWGRWNGGDYTLTRDGSASPATTPFDFVTSEALTDQAQLDSQSGTATYVRTGGTTPVTTFSGNPATVDTFRFDVDFTSQTIANAQIQLTDANSNVLSLTQDSQITLSPGFSLTLSGDYAGLPSDGSLSGHFVGRNAEGVAYSFAGGNSDMGWIQTSGAMKPQ